jgi:polyketide cyclase/dehydrase/lipid transport protein
MKLDHSTIAKCSVESAWQALTEVDRWPEWSKLFSRATWIGGPPWEKGSVLLLEVAQPPAKVRAEVSGVSAPNRVTWVGNVMGVTIKHNFNFVTQADGTTLMQSDIDLSGAATFFISQDMKKKGFAAFVEWFDAMRAHAEKIAVAE